MAADLGLTEDATQKSLQKTEQRKRQAWTVRRKHHRKTLTARLDQKKDMAAMCGTLWVKRRCKNPAPVDQRTPKECFGRTLRPQKSYDAEKRHGWKDQNQMNHRRLISGNSSVGRSDQTHHAGAFRSEESKDRGP